MKFHMKDRNAALSFFYKWHCDHPKQPVIHMFLNVFKYIFYHHSRRYDLMLILLFPDKMMKRHFGKWLETSRLYTIL